jgi:hypothetical protein
MLFCKYFIAQTDVPPIANNPDINSGRRFNMESCLQGFAEYYADATACRSAEYLERSSRLMFLAYLKEYMSIYGFCYTDGKNTDMCRMDVIVEVSCGQYIIELRTRRFDSRGEDEEYQQFADYLERSGKDKGYHVMFDFRQCADKDTEARYIDIDGRRIFEVRV